MTQNGKCQTMNNDNGELETMDNDRQWGMSNNGE